MQTVLRTNEKSVAAVKNFMRKLELRSLCLCGTAHCALERLKVKMMK